MAVFLWGIFTSHTLSSSQMSKPEATTHPIKDVARFRKALLTWFSENAKSYPWRETQDPWAILVSEIMLQQTTVASVLANKRFEKFLGEFPDLTAIAKAPEAQILRAWEGLGYYNRVRNLQKTAQTVLGEYEGVFPKEAENLINLPGVGRYTAGAVSSFAFDQAAPIVDGNIARVLSRLFDQHEPIDSTEGQKMIWAKAADLLDHQSPRLFNSAIMELGQTHCSSKKPTCLVCPVRSFCQTTTPDELPKKKPRKAFVKVEEHALLHLEKGKILLSPGHDTRRKGFWKLPLRSAEDCAHLEAESQHRYTITHHKTLLFLYRSKPQSLLEGECFHELSTLDELPIATPIRKILKTTDLGQNLE